MDSSKLVVEIKEAMAKELSHTLESPDKRWDIWMEGFAATGNVAKAMLLESSVVAKSFREACYIYALSMIKRDPEWAKYGFSVEHLSHWGCKWFDNERDARKAFG